MTLAQTERIKRLKEEIKELKKIYSKKEFIVPQKSILERDGLKRRICGSKKFQLEKHHITPVEFGGSNSSFNIITLCKPCHMFMHCNPTLVLRTKQGHSIRIKQALNKKKINGEKIGRQFGCKDKKPRNKEGYYLRWSEEQ